MFKAVLCRLFNHKWVPMSSSEEGYVCTRCGKQHYGKLRVVGSVAAGAWQDDSLKRDDTANRVE
jgi:Prophage protein (DUF1660)